MKWAVKERVKLRELMIPGGKFGKPDRQPIPSVECVQDKGAQSILFLMAAVRMSKSFSGLGAVAIVMTLILAILLTGCVTGKLSADPPSEATGVGGYEVQVGNSLYPKSRGASVGFERDLEPGEQIVGSVEWNEDYPVYYRWSLYVYAPDNSEVLDWSGSDLKHGFSFTAATAGTYRIELLKRDSPPDWNRWGRG